MTIHEIVELWPVILVVGFLVIHSIKVLRSHHCLVCKQEIYEVLKSTKETK